MYKMGNLLYTVKRCRKRGNRWTIFIFLMKMMINNILLFKIEFYT